jgi:hypothetical protein
MYIRRRSDNEYFVDVRIYIVPTGIMNHAPV